MREITLLQIGMTRFQSVMMTYPIHNEAYRSKLNNNIFNYYQHYEISMLNVEKWLSLLSARMAIIMPKYNLLYESLDIKFNPLENYSEYRELNHIGSEDMERNIATDENNSSSMNQDNTGGTTDTTSTNISSNGYNRGSDTPQGNLTTAPNTTNMGYYATDETYTRGNSDSTGTATNEHHDNTTGSSTNTVDKDIRDTYDKNNKYDDNEHKYGTAPGSNYSKMIEDYRNLAINIDAMIIEELDDLFFTVFNPADYINYCWHNNIIF